MTAINITDYRAGDSLVLRITVRDHLRQVVDLTDASARWGIARKQLNGAFETALITKTVGDGITITDAAAGVLSITLNEGDFTERGEFVHELEVVLASGISQTVASGRFVSAPAIYASPAA